MSATFGQRLRVAIAAANVSRAEIAKACGVTAMAVSNWCNGVSYPRTSHLVTIATTTGATLDYLMDPDPVDIQFDRKKDSQS